MQIDLEPRDYRAEPVKGEPVFVPGALRKAGLNILILVAVLAISAPVYLLAKWAISPLEPIVRALIP